MHYDSDFYRQRHQDRVAEMRRDYERSQKRPKAKSFVSVAENVRSISSRMHVPRRAPVFRP